MSDDSDKFYFQPVEPPDVAGCRNQCIDFCLTESLQERVAELQEQLERYKAVMDELLDAVNEAMYSNATDEAKAKAFKATARYNTLKGE